MMMLAMLWDLCRFAQGDSAGWEELEHLPWWGEAVNGQLPLFPIHCRWKWLGREWETFFARQASRAERYHWALVAREPSISPHRRFQTKKTNKLGVLGNFDFQNFSWIAAAPLEIASVPGEIKPGRRNFLVILSIFSIFWQYKEMEKKKSK